MIHMVNYIHPLLFAAPIDTNILMCIFKLLFNTDTISNQTDNQDTDTEADSLMGDIDAIQIGMELLLRYQS